MKFAKLIVALVLLLPLTVFATEGEKLYKQYCSQCHGQDREGGVGPNLADDQWIKVQPNKQSLVNFIGKGSVSTGVPATGMPAWKNIISDKNIALIADYLLAPSEKTAAFGNSKNSIDTFPEINNFRLPVGFSIGVYADNIENARALTVSPSGVVFVGSRKAGKIYALVDNNKDFIVDKVITVAEGLNSPEGVTFYKGALYVSEMSRVIRFDDIEKNYTQKPKYKIVKDDFPTDKWHGEKIIKVGADEKLYIEIGSPCNVCDKEDSAYSKIYRMNPDGSHFEIFAKGIRNSVGFAWDPRTKEMWFTDNGRDEMGDNLPSCELNHAPKAGLHFGFPYCHAGVIPDPVFGKGHSCDEFEAPAALLGPHVAPLGLEFNTGSQFPDQYKNQLFIAEHGSWNRTQKIGYRVNLITLFNNKVASDTVFVEGFLQNEKVVGRPVDIAFLQDGSMLISDDYGNRVFRVSYTGKNK